MRNLFGKNRLHRGIFPQGDAQELELSASTNGSYYQSYSISFLDPWFGRKRPNQLSIGAFFSRQTDISSSYYNSSYYNNYYNMLYGYGNYNSSYYNNYSNYYDPDKYIELFGVNIGFGKRLSWPDNNFRFNASLGYTRYMMKNWEYFIIQNGHCNNINLTLSLSRSMIDSGVFPRSGSQISASVSLTPPYSLWDGVDYEHMATNYRDANYQSDMSRKYKWIEYHKWKFNSRFFTPLGSAQKCFVLMTRFDFGLLGHYSKYKKSPFETFYVGGDGMSGYSSTYYSETIGLRGYDNGALTQGYNYGYAYDRMTLELRYPLMLQGSTNIYALAFAEAGNAWTEMRKFNPFDMKRSAGIGVRLFLPMVGLMGIDWAYGFDNINGSKSYSGSQFHFVLGQEF
jgi:outer membrane protein insertion porin family